MTQLTCSLNAYSQYLTDPCVHSHAFATTSLLVYLFVGACHASSLWCNIECIHHSLYFLSLTGLFPSHSQFPLLSLSAVISVLHGEPCI